MEVQNSYKTPSPPHVKNGFLNNYVIISAWYNKCISIKKLIGKIKSYQTYEHPCHLKKWEKAMPEDGLQAYSDSFRYRPANASESSVYA